MEMEEKVARMQEIERRGLLDRLTPRQRAGWEEYKRRHNMSMQATPEQMPEDSTDWIDTANSALRTIGGAVEAFDKGRYFGLGKRAGGLVNAIGSWPVDRVAGLMGVENTPTFGDRYNEIVQDAKEMNKEFAENHPVANFGLELAGGIKPANAITRGLAQKGVKSALGQSALGGGIGGALYAADESEKLSDLPVNMLAGGVGGTVGGAALHSAISGIGTVGGLFRNNLKKGMDYIRKTKGDEYLQNMIDEATQKGVSLAEVADDRALKAVQMARQQTSAADDIVTQNAQAIRDNVPNKNTDTLNDMFGTKSGYQMAQEAEQAAMEKARPMFNDLEAYGDLDPLYVKPGEKVPTGKLSKEQADALLKQEMGKLPTREQLASYTAESKFNPNNDYTRADALTALEKRADKMGVKLHNNIDEVKDAQLKLINKSNPAPDEVHTWIRKKEDIKTFDEALQDKDYIDYNEFTPDYTRQMANDAIKNGKIKVYSSYDIKNGTFVTPSKMEAMSYSGNGKVDELVVPLQDVAWISPMEGQYAPVKYGKGHFLKKEDRLPFARTLENTVKKPDVTFTQSDGNTIYSKKYGNIQEKPFDYVVYDETGNPYTKYMTNAEYLSDNINAADNISISGRVMDSTNVGYVAPYPKPTSNIPSLGAVVNSNNVINSAVKSVKGAYSSLKELPDTDARVILETRKLLSRQTKSPDATLAFQAKQALKEFDDALPTDFRKGLEEANKIYKDNYQFSEAKESASDIFKANVSPEEFSDKFGKMTAEEKRALRGGLRDELFSIIENRANETLGWNRVVPRAVQSKIRRVMGVEEGNKLIEYAQGQLKSMRNLNKILGGSQTSEKQGLRDNVGFVRNMIKRPVDTLTGLVPYANARNKGIAELMTNPSADLARATYEQVASPRGWEAVYQALYNPRGFTRYNTALAAYLAGRELQQ